MRGAPAPCRRQLGHYLLDTSSLTLFAKSSRDPLILPSLSIGAHRCRARRTQAPIYFSRSFVKLIYA